MLNTAGQVFLGCSWWQPNPVETSWSLDSWIKEGKELPPKVSIASVLNFQPHSHTPQIIESNSEPGLTCTPCILIQTHSQCLWKNHHNNVDGLWFCYYWYSDRWTTVTWTLWSTTQRLNTQKSGGKRLSLDTQSLSERDYFWILHYYWCRTEHIKPFIFYFAYYLSKSKYWSTVRLQWAH